MRSQAVCGLGWKSLTWHGSSEVRGEENVCLDQQVGPDLKQGFEEVQGRQVCLPQQQPGLGVGLPFLVFHTECGFWQDSHGMLTLYFRAGKTHAENSIPCVTRWTLVAKIQFRL